MGSDVAPIPTVDSTAGDMNIHISPTRNVLAFAAAAVVVALFAAAGTGFIYRNKRATSTALENGCETHHF